MSAATLAREPWADENQRALVEALARVRRYVEQGANGAHGAHGRPVAGIEPMGLPAALARLVSAFGLSPFERDVLLLCAGPELDGGFEAALRAAGRGAPSFALALAILPDAHWTALSPAAPLRYWGLVEPTPGGSAVTAPLRLDERILHFLAGAGFTDERLESLVRTIEPAGAVPPSHGEIARRVAAACREQVTPLIGLWGPDASGKRALAAAATRELGLSLRALRASDLPQTPAERASLARVWERAAVLGGWALLLDLHDDDDGAPAAGAGPEAAAGAFAEAVRAPVLLAAREPLRGLWRPVLAFDVPRPSARERLGLWQEALGPAAAALDGAGPSGPSGASGAGGASGGEGALAALATHFELGGREIASVVERARAACAPHVPTAAALWQGCRGVARPRLEDLARRIEARAGWDDLVLPPAEKEALHEIAAQVRERARVYDAWGFGARSTRGLGVSALFAGPSGTGKTMASEVLAGELALDLYHIDLSQVVSKYIGETEKNLRRVFEAAEEGGAILLFDEADALFGRRSEVKDSHDRYANVEVSYLLQRMEAYRGLAILTTNRREALDRAFLRRLRFIVEFPFPGLAERAEIWRRVFPRATPTEGLVPEKLARLNVAGGNIQSMALHAAFLAAAEGTPVRMSHLLRAARRESAKLERPLAATEIGGWT